jgi:uncharacterized membrane protein
MVAFAVIFTYLAIKKFNAFWVPAVDMGIEHQVFWAGGRGGFLYQTVLFAIPHLNHVALANQLLAPLTLAFPSPYLLFVLQAAALASAALPAYLLARRFTSSRYLALAFGLSPLLFASAQWLALYDFHPRTLAPALVLWALWGMEAGKPRLGLLFFFFTTLLLEELALYVGAAGLFLALGLKRRRWGLLIAGYALVYFVTATYVVYPQLMDVSDTASNPILHASGVARTPSELVAYAARHPLVFLGRATEPARWSYLLHLATPWGFLPAAAGWGWLAYATPVIYALFSRVPTHYSLQHQYVIPLLPFLVYFSLRTWGRLEERLSGASAAALRRAATAFLIVAGVAGSAAFGPLGVRYNRSWYRGERWTRGFPKVARFVAPDRSLAASMFLLPHFSERWRIYLLPHKFRYERLLLPDEVIVSRARVREPWKTPPTISEARNVVTLVRLLRNERYGCVYADGDYVLLRRGATAVIPAGKAFEWTFQTLEEEAFNYNVGLPVWDERARNYRALYCDVDQGLLGTMARAGPRYWPPGLVKVNYRMAVTEPELPFAPVADLVVVEYPASGPPRAVAVRSVLPAELPPTRGYGWASVAFECRADRRYVFQLYPLGNGDLYLDYIYVEAPKLTVEWALRNTKSDEERRALAAKGEALQAFYRPPPPGFKLR